MSISSNGKLERKYAQVEIQQNLCVTLKLLMHFCIEYMSICLDIALKISFNIS